MNFTDILYDKKDGVARITINRPEVYNAIRGRTTDEMVVALEDSAADESVRAVVVVIRATTDPPQRSDTSIRPPYISARPSTGRSPRRPSVTSE